MGRVPIIAVVGGNSASPALLAEAERLGAGLMEAGFRLATGGRGGVMEATSRGARQSPAWQEGRIVGVLPSTDPAQANPYVDIVFPTGMGYARNVLLVSMADAVVAVGGGSGTLSEVALAWQLDKPLVALDLDEGWSSRLAGTTLDGRRSDAIARACSAAEVLSLLTRPAGQRSRPPGAAGP